MNRNLSILVNSTSVAILVASFLLVGITSSQPACDAWADLNDDGWINGKDAILLGNKFGTFGTPLNKTEMLLDLQARVEALETGGYIGAPAYDSGWISEYEYGGPNVLIHGLNTTGYAFGNYPISAYLIPVQGEIDASDNTLFDGVIVVTIPGDINGDQYVNAKDAIALGVAFSPFGVYNSNADINGDGYCNAKDAIILGIHFNEHWE